MKTFDHAELLARLEFIANYAKTVTEEEIEEVSDLAIATIRAQAERIAELEQTCREHIEYGQEQRAKWCATKCQERIAELEDAANKAVERSGHGYECLQDGWIAVPAEPFYNLRRVLSAIEDKNGPLG